MRRKSTLPLDKLDKEILYALDVNARASYSQLGKKMRMSKQLVKYRIERLESEGFIKGYYAMIDTSRLGYITFRGYLKFRNLTPERKNIILTYLKSSHSIWAVILLAGKWDVALGISVQDIYDFYRVWEKMLKNHLPYISDYSLCVYSPIYHFAKSYLIGKEDTSPIRILGGCGKSDFDEKDMLLLSILSKNCRSTLLHLSQSLCMTPESVSYRIKQLEKKGIVQGYRAMIDVHKMGYEFYKADIRLSSFDKINSILTFCHLHPNIYQVDKTIGGETLEIEFHVRSLKEMLTIMDDFQKKFPNTVERFNYITVLSEEKVTYMPVIS